MVRVHVTIDDDAWSEWRIQALASRLGVLVPDVLGRLAWLWRRAISSGTDTVSARTVDGHLGDGAATAIVDCALADAVAEGQVRLHGVAKRLASRERHVAQRVAAGHSRAVHANRIAGRFGKEPPRSTSGPPATYQRPAGVTRPPETVNDPYKTTSEPLVSRWSFAGDSPARALEFSEISTLNEISREEREEKKERGRGGEASGARGRARDPTEAEADTATDPRVPLRSAPLVDAGASTLPPKRKRKAKGEGFTADEMATAMRILGYFTAKTGVAYQGAQQHIRLIRARLAEGLTEHDLRCVIAYAWNPTGLGWKTSTTSDGVPMSRYLVPETLFGPIKIAKYLDAARAWYRDVYEPTLVEKPTNGTHGPSAIVSEILAPHDPPRSRR